MESLMYNVVVWFEDEQKHLDYAVRATSAQEAVDFIDKSFAEASFPFQVVEVLLPQTGWCHKGYRP